MSSQGTAEDVGRGVNTLYIGGTDEYGTTSEAKALVEKCTPQEFWDKSITRSWQTASSRASALSGYADARGDQCDLYGQLLEFLQLKHPRCKIDGSKPVTKDTKYIFFKLDKLQPDVEAFFRDSAANGAWSNNSKVITSA
ncbi:tRNA synthetases class I (M) domain-containing protein [Hirsutella rhossiliensis]|uniref:tRNA synthetases class I (M) domain-containing protein n=1 Tax=Hirsutella rhossiliensis TaxID=111463 RepID=A0A9P8SGS3_9HYPO|nr:tRNA synthetases class I (M) domain-containing protein [Hirsutella rhossiliensis]KAH0960800.1 tRNA synthetases class I (M) domain-containing protein [Hirsutella rhossiliensis]